MYCSKRKASPPSTPSPKKKSKVAPVKLPEASDRSESEEEVVPQRSKTRPKPVFVKSVPVENPSLSPDAEIPVG